MSAERFRFARELAGFTQTELARRIEEMGIRRIAQGTIAGIETGRWEPSADVAEAIAMATGHPVAFLEADDPPDFPSGSLLLFRSKAGVSARDEAQVRRQAQLTMEITLRLTNKVPALSVRIPRLDGLAPVEAAQLTRSVLGRSPDTPILDLVRTLERAGVIVLALPIRRDPIEAFSAWVDARLPCIAMLANAAPDRQRFSIAHELGHLVMHHVVKGALVEDEANAFAAEFLTPGDVLKEEFSTPITLPQLLALKVRWHVSVRSLISTAWVTKVITSRQRVSLIQRVNKEFGGKSEPTLFPAERPRGLLQLAEMQYGRPVDFSRLAGDLRLSEQQVRDVLGGYQPGSPDHEKVIRFPDRN